MERVLVIGSPGSGKSTLTTQIARRTGLPLIHLDRHHWRSGWVEAGRAEWERQVGDLIAGDRWVIDGNYGGSLQQRLARADTVIWLDLPVWICLTRVMRRAVQYRGRTRPDMAEGCLERLNWEFFSYTASFPWKARRKLVERLRGYSGRIIRLRTPREVRRFLVTL